MGALNTTELAATLGLSKGRISQLVAAGKLDGCYRGDGRARRFDLEKAAAALGHRLDPGQMMGNGAATKRRVKEIASGAPEKAPAKPKARKKSPAADTPTDERDGPLPETDPDRYKLARIDKAEQEARKLRRQNAEAAGQYVLASEVHPQTRRVIAREIAGFESVLREAARQIADELGVDMKSVRQILIGRWRAHREERGDVLSGEAETARLSDAERAGNI